MTEPTLTAAESKATYAEIMQYVLDKTGLKVSQLYIAQVKRKHGLIERIKYILGKKKSKVELKEKRNISCCSLRIIHCLKILKGYH